MYLDNYTVLVFGYLLPSCMLCLPYIANYRWSFIYQTLNKSVNPNASKENAYVLQIELTADVFALLLSCLNPRQSPYLSSTKNYILPAHIFILDFVYCTQTPIATT